MERATPQDQLRLILQEASEMLALEKEEGLSGVEADPALVQALAAPIPIPRARPAPSPAPPVAPTDAPATAPAGTLEDIAARVAACTRCPLCETRTRTVPGQGHPRPEVAFVGEGPGADEDRQGLAFVGRAGQLLTKIIGAMGLTRDEVWIGNIVKCRPPGNRVPLPDEMAACLPYLREQLALLQPKIIVCLGATAVKGLLNTTTGITKLRGTWMTFEGIDVMPTYHPAFLLRNPSGKREVWDDMKEVLGRLGRPIPQHGKGS
jgi:DNA polymerase